MRLSITIIALLAAQITFAQPEITDRFYNDNILIRVIHAPEGCSMQPSIQTISENGTNTEVELNTISSEFYTSTRPLDMHSLGKIVGESTMEQYFIKVFESKKLQECASETVYTLERKEPRKKEM